MPRITGLLDSRAESRSQAGKGKPSVLLSSFVILAWDGGFQGVGRIVL